METHGNIREFDYINFHIVFDNGTTVNIISFFKTIFDSVETYLEAFQRVFQATNPSRAAFNFSAATDALSKAISESQMNRQGFRASLKSSHVKLGKLDKEYATAQNLVQDLNRMYANLSEQSAKATQAMAVISERSSEASAISATASELKKRVETFKADFDGLQKTIEQMQSSYAIGDQNLKRLISDFESQSQSFEDMIARSDEMLSGSTVAGLATEFGKIKDKLSGDLKSAHKSFLWSILALFICALPLIAFIFSPFLAMSTDDPDVISILNGIGTGQSGWQYVGQVFARFVILLPGVWLVTFTNRRYNSLFRLQEHYSYKYSMAVSVEGFKKQSPENADLIAALIFEQLAFNPADKIGSRHDRQSDSPNTISTMFVDFLRKRITNSARE